MITYKISDKLRTTVERIYTGSDRTRVIKSLEEGKIIYHGGAKMKADKVETPEKASVAVPTGKTDEKDNK